MRALGPGLVWAWVGCLVGMLALAGPGGLAAWPARDRPHPNAPEAVNLQLDDRDLADDPPAALTRWITRARGRPPTTIEGHAVVIPTDPWPSRYLLRPQLLTRR